MNFSLIGALSFLARKDYRMSVMTLLAIVFLFGFGISAKANDAPVAFDDTSNMQQGGNIPVYVLTNDTDADNDTLIVSAIATPAHGTATIVSNSYIEYTPTSTYYGTDTFTYTVSDGNGGTDTGAITISINGTPIAVTDSVSTNKNTSVVISPLTNDTDPDNNTPLSLNYVNYPMYGSITQDGNQVTYIPSFNWTGTETFTYYISDALNGSATGTIEVTVVPTNVDPEATDDTADMQQGQSTSIYALMNDSDADYDNLTISNVTTPAHGTATIVSNSYIDYTPTSTYYGTDTFTYTVSDGNGGTDTATVTISINGSPIAVTDAVTTPKNTSVTISPLTNDTDPDNNTPLSLNYVNYPMYGSITQDGNQVTYTPSFNWTGTETFTYYISDALNGSATGTIEVTVVPTNVNPEATDDTADMQQGESTSIYALMNDSDADYDNLTISEVSTPAHGTATIVSNSYIEYTPTSTYYGTDTFTYTVSDGNGGTDTGSITISINGSPIAVTDAVSTNKNTSVTISPLTNDTDPDNNTPLSLNYVNYPMYGSITQDGNQITYTPSFNWTGTETFTYYISDALNGSATGTIEVTVVPINVNPEATDDTADMQQGESTSIYALMNDSDADYDNLTISNVTTPVHGTATIVSNSYIEYTPTSTYYGTDTFTYTVSDGNGGTDTATVTISINGAPIAVTDAVTTPKNTSVTISPLVNDYDPDENTPLTINYVNYPMYGSITQDGNQVTYTPSFNWTGTETFTYYISDALNGSATGTIEVTVVPTNVNPEATDDTADMQQGESTSIYALMNDSDADYDNLIISNVTTPAHGTAAIVSNSYIEYTPTSTYYGTETFTYTVSDGNGGTDTGTITININGTPIAVTDAVSTNKNTSVVISPLTNDTDPDNNTPLSLNYVNSPMYGSITQDGNQITYTPSFNWTGTETFSYYISDALNGSATGTIEVTVVPTNVNPEATDDTADMQQGQSTSIYALMNDSDADYDNLTISNVTTPAHGTATIVSNSYIEYTPTSTYYGTDTFTYTVSDGNGGTDTATVTISINGAPVAVTDTVTTPKNTSVTISPLVNDYDPDENTPLTINYVNYPMYGSITQDGNQITYTPSFNWTGTETFTYYISDSAMGYATGTIEVTVTDINIDPVAVDDSVSIQQGQTTSISVLTNDSDINNDTLTVSAVTTPLHGTATITNNGSLIEYIPETTWYGTDTFTYTVSDGNGGTDTATVTININGTPVAVDDTATTTFNTAVTINVLGNDTDPDNGTLSIYNVGTPQHGTVSIINNNVIYTPNNNYDGTDEFTYSISDTNGGVDYGNVSVTITNAQVPPVAVSDSATTLKNYPVTFNPVTNDYDLNADTIALVSVSTPAHGTATILNNNITYTPDTNWAGTETLTYTITDGHGNNSDGTITIEVTIHTPTAVNDSATTDFNQPVTINVLANDSDSLNKTPLNIVSVSTCANGTVSIVTNQVHFEPATDFSGVTTFTYTIENSDGDTATAQVTVTVEPANSNPIAVDDTADTQQGQSTVIAVLTNDSDPDNDALTVSTVSTPAHGTATINNGNVEYTPESTWYGTDSFTYTISDGNGGTDTATVTISINGAPITVTDAETTTKNNSVVISPLANDSDPDNNTPLSLNYVNQPAHGSITQNGNQITYTPNFNWLGVDTFTYSMSDSMMGFATGTIEVTVTGSNTNPVAVDDSASVQQGQSTSISVLMNDSDADYDMLTVSAVDTPAHGTATINNNSVDYTPTSTYSGIDTFTYTISDGNGGTATATVTININGSPVAVDDTATTDEDVPVIIDVLANDSDPDINDTLTIEYPGWSSNGTISITQDNKIQYTPNHAWFGTDFFSYNITDANGGNGWATVTVTVNHVNHAPVATDDTGFTQQDMGTYIYPQWNDTDVDNDMLSISDITQPTHGTVTQDTYSLHYVPTTGWYGVDTFTYTISDGHGGTDVATVTVTVNGTPIAMADIVSTLKNIPVTISPLANDTDPDNNTPLSLNMMSYPMHGMITQDGNQITFTPYFNWTGIETLTYYVYDSMMGYASGTIEITVIPTNANPVATDDSAFIQQDQSTCIDVLMNDTDVDWDMLTVSAVNTPAHGTATIINNNCSVEYVPDTSWYGTDTFTYTVSDGNGGTATATITITVNGAPIAVDDDVTVLEDSTDNIINVLANDTDPDEDVPLSILWTGMPMHGTLNVVNNQIVYTPIPLSYGIDTFSYTITDARGGMTTATVSVTVTHVNHAPTADDTTYFTYENTSTTVYVNAWDVDGDAITIIAVSTPSHGTASIVDGIVNYTPDGFWNGTDSFTYTVSDGQYSATATITMTVYYQQYPPVATDDYVEVEEDSSTVIDILSNDYDPHDEELIIAYVSQGQHGSIQINIDNTVTYTATDNNWIGEDTFTYTIYNADSYWTAQATVHVHVVPTNYPPIMTDDISIIAKNTTVTIPVLVNDYDPDNDTLTITSVTQGGHGTVTINNGNDLTYVPVTDFVGVDTFTYTICDGHGHTVTGNVRVEVNADAPLVRVTVASDGTEGNDDSYGVAISANGNYVVFASEANTLVLSDTNDVADIFIFDRQMNTKERVSVSSTGEQANDLCWSPSVSSDGRYVAFVSSATNLVDDDTNDFPDIFVRDRQTGTTIRISITSNGDEANACSWSPVISANGCYVAFLSDATNLVTETEQHTNVFRYDMQTGDIIRISQASDGTDSDGDSDAPVISVDGRFIAFTSDATNLIDEDTNECRDAFRYDCQTESMVRVSLLSDGTEGNGDTISVAMSDDGYNLSFVSDATNFVVNDGNGAADVFFVNLQTGDISRISAGNQQSWEVAMSSDARFITFTSDATNIVTGDTNSVCDVFVFDRQLSTTTRISIANSGAEGNSDSHDIAISKLGDSSTGFAIAFASRASNLIAGDTNNSKDIFVSSTIINP